MKKKKHFKIFNRKNYLKFIYVYVEKKFVSKEIFKYPEFLKRSVATVEVIIILFFSLLKTIIVSYFNHICYFLIFYIFSNTLVLISNTNHFMQIRPNEVI